MSIEKVRKFMKEYGMDDKILEFPVSSATVELAAKALNTEGKRIAKSLSFLAHEKAVMIVTAGDGRIDNKKYKSEFSCKAKMLTPEQVDEMIGHSIGGVCPFAVNDGVEIYLDESLKRFQTVFPACGSSNSAIELTIPQLEELSGFVKWVDICKVPDK